MNFGIGDSMKDKINYWCWRWCWRMEFLQSSTPVEQKTELKILHILMPQKHSMKKEPKCSTHLSKNHRPLGFEDYNCFQHSLMWVCFVLWKVSPHARLWINTRSEVAERVKHCGWAHDVWGHSGICTFTHGVSQLKVPNNPHQGSAPIVLFGWDPVAGLLESRSARPTSLFPSHSHPEGYSKDSVCTNKKVYYVMLYYISYYISHTLIHTCIHLDHVFF